MRVCGIIAEYNPLHNGHAYHIAQARLATKCDYLIIAMSGSFTQRGEPAIFDKWTRARWALEAGADMVLELPALVSLQSAQGFASGGVRLLAALGVLTHLCFGCELAEAALLAEAAQWLDNEPLAFQDALQSAQREGMSFPRARDVALQRAGAKDAIVQLLRAPNGILGVEYVRALNRYAPEASIVPLHRQGEEYHSTALNSFASATAIRKALCSSQDVQEALPEYVYSEIRRLCAVGAGPITADQSKAFTQYAFKRLPLEALADLPEVSEGLHHAFAQASAQCATLDELLFQVKSKRFTLSRLRRIAAYALLGITQQAIDTANSEEAPYYARVLGFKRNAQPLLSEIKQRASIPLVSRKAEMDKLQGEGAAVLRYDLFANDVQALCAPAAKFRSGGQDFVRQIVLL